MKWNREHLQFIGDVMSGGTTMPNHASNNKDDATVSLIDYQGQKGEAPTSKEGLVDPP